MAVPAAATVSRLGPDSEALAATSPEEAHERRHEPENRRQEGKRDHGLELPAWVASEDDVAPRKDSPAGAALQVLF